MRNVPDSDRLRWSWRCSPASCWSPTHGVFSFTGIQLTLKQNGEDEEAASSPRGSLRGSAGTGSRAVPGRASHSAAGGRGLCGVGTHAGGTAGSRLGVPARACAVRAAWWPLWPLWPVRLRPPLSRGEPRQWPVTCNPQPGRSGPTGAFRTQMECRPLPVSILSGVSFRSCSGQTCTWGVMLPLLTCC